MVLHGSRTLRGAGWRAFLKSRGNMCLHRERLHLRRALPFKLLTSEVRSCIASKRLQRGFTLLPVRAWALFVWGGGEALTLLYSTDLGFGKPQTPPLGFPQRGARFYFHGFGRCGR